MHAPAPAQTRLGLQLALGALLLIAAAWLFGAIAEDVATGDSLTQLDIEIALWLHQRATPTVTRWLLVITHLHSTIAISCYAVVIGVLLYAKRHWQQLVTLFACVAGGMVLNVAMKFAFHRARPLFDQPLLTLPTYSFPSGHVAASTVFYGLGVAWVFGRTRKAGWRVLAIVATASAIALVAFSRMYLGVHYLSDVAAAFAEGVAWLALCLSAFAAFWRRVPLEPAPPDARGANG